jgi:hypothetical protein
MAIMQFLGTIVLTMCLFAAPGFASVTYSLVPYPALQNGYSLAGTIVTNGTFGVLNYSDIVSALFVVSNGVNSFQLTSANDVHGVTKLVADANNLVLPLALNASFPSFSIGNSGFDKPGLQYDYNINSGSIFSDFICTIDHPTTLTFLWDTFPASTNAFNATGSPILIATTTPEPAITTLLFFTAIIAVLIYRGHRAAAR